MDRLEPSRCRLVVILLSLATIVGSLMHPAIAHQQEAIQLLQQGVGKIQRGYIEQGLQDLRAAIEIEPRLATAHFYAGQASAQLQEWRKAYEYFVAATEQAPGFAEAHMQACRVAYTLQMFDESFTHAIRAAQAGIDMGDAFDELEAKAEPPEDWQQLLQAPRVLMGNIDTEALLSQDSAFGSAYVTGGIPNGGADQQTASGVDPFAEVSVPTSTNVPFVSGPHRVGQSGLFRNQLHEVWRQFGVEFTSSSAFGVVPRVELATYVFFIKVDAVRDGALEGFARLLDPLTGEEVYGRPISLSHISSAPDLRTEVARQVRYMEQWLRETKE